METLMQALQAATHMDVVDFRLPDGRCELPRPLPPQPFDRLLFVMEGVKREWMSLNGRLARLDLPAGSVYLVRRGIWEFYGVETAHTLLCIVPRGGYLRVSCYRFPAGLVPGEWREPEAVHTGRPAPRALLAVFDALREPGGEASAHVPHLIRAAATLALAECRRPPAPAGKAAATFERVRAYVDYHCHEPINRREVAARFGLNVNYLSQLFREAGGSSFQVYVEERRFEMARRLLSGTDLPLKSVAAHCGFAGTNYFIRRFRDRFGQTPGQMRLHAGGEGTSPSDQEIQ